MHLLQNRRAEPFDPFIEITAVDEIPRPVVVRANDVPNGFVIPRHHHKRGQLIFAASGVMVAVTDESAWTVGPNQAIWMPPGVEHEIRASGSLRMRSLFLTPKAGLQMPDRCTLMSITPLVRELILHAASLPKLYDMGSPDDRIMRVILEQIQFTSSTSLNLLIPRDPRLRRIANALLDNPADKRTLEDFAKFVGASPRTITRLFLREVNMPFRQWRMQVRLFEALRRLAQNCPVVNVALDLNYNSPSAFVSAFKKTFGVTPGRYFETNTRPEYISRS